MPRTTRWAQRQAIWNSMPRTSYAMFIAGVFLMFAPVGVLADMTHLGADPFQRLVADVLFSGGVAVAYVIVARRPQWLPALVIAHIALSTQFDRMRDALLAAAHGHGPQLDDQTLLLIRATA